MFETCQQTVALREIAKHDRLTSSYLNQKGIELWLIDQIVQ